MVVPLPTFPEAARLVYQYAQNLLHRSPRTERIPLDHANGRILAQPVRADRDMPAFPRSTRDGYAVRAAEASDRAWLRVAGSIRAGDPPAAPLPANAAWEIMTGAAVPPSADAVAMLEHVEHDGAKIRLARGRTLDPGENIVLAAAEARAGDEIIPVGTRLSPAQIAAAATCGYAAVDVYLRPRVAILTTGDELVPVDAAPGPSQIRNSNASMLAALVSQAGGESHVLPSAADSPEAIEAALRAALHSDLLLISGGVSAGKFDLVEPALARLGAQFHFTGVRIQPGKPLVFAEIVNGSRVLPLFGHPGNPISTAATFLLFAAPVLRALAGVRDFVPQFAAASVTRQTKGKPGLTRFVPSHTTCDPLSGNLPEVAPVPWQGSGDLAAFARANCFLVVPEDTDQLAAGDLARILPI
jgi:molybdopterin molybdotransferase